MGRQRRRPPPSWWSHVPPHQRLNRQSGVVILRLRDGLCRRGVLITTLLAAYTALCLGLLLSGAGLVALLAALPLLLVPPVGCLAYWLLWKEFHH